MDDVKTIPSERISIVMINPTLRVSEGDRPFRCTFCGKTLFYMNKHFSYIQHGGVMVAGETELPNSVFRFTRLCGTDWCRQYYIIYFDGSNPNT